MKLIFSIFFFIIQFCAVAQEVKYVNTSLNEILSGIEKKFDVKFSYNTTQIKKIKITLLLKQQSLQEIVLEIEKKARLVFDKIDDRYFTIEVIDTLTICGYIKNAIDGTVVDGASVILQGKFKGVVSDKKGFFKIKNTKRSDTLSISFLGYKKLILPVNKFQDNRCEVYTLLSENFNLNEVIIQDYLASGIVKTRDGSVRIKPNSLDILAGLSEPDVLQNIQLLPGMESPSETASGLYIRGGSPDQNLILWDGIKMYNTDHFFGMLSSFNLYIIKDIKIYRSGAKPEYGNRISGVIDIKTDSNLPEKIQGSVGVNMTHFDGNIKIPVSKKIGFMISARRSLADIISTPTFNRFTERIFQNTIITENQRRFDPNFSEQNGAFYFTDFNIKIISELSDKDKITFSGLFTKNKLDYSFSTEESKKSSSDKLNIQNKGLNTTWNRKWNERVSSKAEFYYSNYNFSYTGFNPFLEEAQTVSKEPVVHYDLS